MAIASADQVCNHYLVHADKGDSFICALAVVVLTKLIHITPYMLYIFGIRVARGVGW